MSAVVSNTCVSVAPSGGPVDAPRARGLELVFDKVYGYVSDRFVLWASKGRCNRRLRLADLSRFDKVSYCEVGFVPRSLRGYDLLGVFAVYYAKDVNGVVVEFRPYRGVVKRLGVNGSVRLALDQLVEVVTSLFVDVLHYLPSRRAASALARVIRGLPGGLLDAALARAK